MRVRRRKTGRERSRQVPRLLCVLWDWPASSQVDVPACQPVAGQTSVNGSQRTSGLLPSSVAPRSNKVLACEVQVVPGIGC